MFTNLTPHALVFRNAAGDRDLPPSGTGARVDTHVTPLRTVLGMPLRSKSLGQVTGLPDPDGVTVFVVSGMVLEALRNSGCVRTDVVAPATGPKDGAIRNEAGHVVAVTEIDGLA
jgi:hypothetical protein